MNTVTLMAAFSGDKTSHYEPLFRYSEETKITRIEVHAVGTESTTGQYSGGDVPLKQVNNILRITTADGFEGISGVDTYRQGEFSDQLLLELRGVANNIFAFESIDPVEVGAMLKRTQPTLSDEAHSSIDIALWDLAARKANRPLYKLLGAKQDSIQPYASFPFFVTLPEYVDAVREYAKLGFQAFKFHVWGEIEADTQLVTLVQQVFANDPYQFMIDLEGKYDFEDALRLGRKMDEGLFVWLEAPIADRLVSQYGELRKRLAVSIIPSGYDIYSHEFIRQGINADAWDAGRFDVTVAGGISTALELLIIANDADLGIEIQSWGHSLAQAANLHLMLANERTRYFEAPTPRDAFEFGMKNGIPMDANAQAIAPAGPGLGVEVDWEQLTMADFYKNTVIDLTRQ